MKTIRIYSKRLAEYLTARDFKILKVIQDISRPTFSNWIFEDTFELRETHYAVSFGNIFSKMKTDIQ